MCVCLGGQPAPFFERQRLAFELFEHAVVVGRIDDYNNAIVVLRCGPNHRRPADVYVFDRIVDRRIFACDRLFEWVEVYNQHVDWLDTVFGHDTLVRAASAKQAAVDFRVQGLDAAIHDLGEAGLVRDIDRVDAGFA